MSLMKAPASLATLLIASMLCGVSSAGTISLGSFMGDTVSFNNLIENNGLISPAPFPSLYAPVSVSGDTLTFGTTDFMVEATAAGIPAVLDHSISFSVESKPGELPISSILLQETFFAETTGTGLVEGFYGGSANGLVGSPPEVVTASASAGQSGDGSNVLVPAPLLFTFDTPVTRADITIDNRLTAFKGLIDDFAKISKRGLSVTVFPVPEPTSAMIFACGFGLLTSTRRRRR